MAALLHKAVTALADEHRARATPATDLDDEELEPSFERLIGCNRD